MTKSAVLFLTYKRFSTAEIVFQAIRSAKPPKLYFASNAAKLQNKNEVKQVEKVRSLLDLIDWPCKVYKLIHVNHLSVKYSISSAIDWFFQHEEEGIILEDDCVPHPTFFAFCDQLLERYRHDSRIAMINGFNCSQSKKININNDSYFFTKNVSIWGWASWRRAWLLYDVNMKEWPNVDRLFIEDILKYRISKIIWLYFFGNTYNNKIDTWDFQWVFSIWSNSMMAISPKENLVQNIGFSEEATHTKYSDIYSKIISVAMKLPLKHPKFILRDRITEAHEEVIEIKNMAKNLIRKKLLIK